MKKWLWAAAVAMIGIVTAGDACLAIPGAGGIVLEFPIGARYNAMGEAGTALAQDATASWWNPGGLAFAGARGKLRDVQIMQSSLAEGLADDISLYWAGYAFPFSSVGNLGVYLTYLDMGEQEGRDEDGNFTGTFKSYEFAFGAAYGARVTPNLGLGIGLKYFRDKLAENLPGGQTGGSGDSYGIDLGVLYKIPSVRMNAALTAVNVGFGNNIVHVDEDQSDPMPRKLTAGLAYSPFSTEASSVLIIADLIFPLVKWKEQEDGSFGEWGFGLNTDDEVWGVGAEWSYVQSLFVRVGYKKDQTGDIKDMTWGLGLDLERWLGQAITFGFAQVPQAQDLDPVKRFSLGYRF